MRRLSLLAVLALGLAACGGSGGSGGSIKITFGRSGGTMVPNSVTIAPDGKVTSSNGPASPGTFPRRITSSEAAKLSALVRNGLPTLKSETCPGTFPDESSLFITALGKTVTLRGACEPAFTTLWNELAKATSHFAAG